LPAGGETERNAREGGGRAGEKRRKKRQERKERKKKNTKNPSVLGGGTGGEGKFIGPSDRDARRKRVTSKG